MNNRQRFVLRRSLLAAGLATALGGSAALADETVNDHGWGSQAAVGVPAFLERVEQFRQARNGIVGATRGAGPTGPTLVVSNCNDAGTGSLREAASLVTVEETTIDLTSLQCSTITLSSGAVQLPGYSVYLTGPGADALTIDANHASRVLEAAGPLYVESLTLANGRADTYGGCVSAQYSFVAKYSVISGCEVGSTSVAQAYGGALAANGGVGLYESTISGNSATAQVFAAGGGVAALGLIFAVYSSRVENNIAYAIGSTPPAPAAGPAPGAAGGGLWTEAFLGVGYDSVITGNAAVSVDGIARGGGVMVAAEPPPPLPRGSAQSGLDGESRVGKYGGAGVVQSTISGNAAVSANGLAMGAGIQAGDLRQAALRGGSAAYFPGSVELTYATVSGNHVGGDFAQGGGITAFGPVTAEYSSVSGNSALGSIVSFGGGISVYYESAVALRNTTVSGNSANDPASSSEGGGIWLHPAASMAVYNSTVAGNTTTGTGGGIFLSANVLRGSEPSGSEPRGINAPILVSSIVADNQASSASDIGATGPTNVSGDHNLVESAGVNVDLPPDTLIADPLLQPLRGNGGPTATHALLSCSPAIDNGSNPLAFSWDQRGEPFSRSWAASQDIGAFELQPNADVIFRNGFDPDPCPPL